MKKILSSLLAVSMLFSLTAVAASAEGGSSLATEQLAYMDLDRASPEQQAAIRAARQKLIFGGQSWTVNGAVSRADLDRGTREKLPEFSDLFPGWEVPTIDLLPPDDESILSYQKTYLRLDDGKPSPQATAFDRHVNALLHPIGSYYANLEIASILGNGNDFVIFEQTSPSGSEKHNFAVSDRSQGLVVGWAAGLTKGQGAQVSTRSGAVYTFHGNVFSELDQGWRAMRITDDPAFTGQTDAVLQGPPPEPDNGLTYTIRETLPAGSTWQDGKPLGTVPSTGGTVYLYAEEGTVPYSLSLSNSGHLLAWYPNLIPGKTGVALQTKLGPIYELAASVSGAAPAELELVVTDQPPQGYTWTAANPFTDLSEEADSWPFILSAYASGLLVGTSDTQFSPDATLTRAMLWSVLARMNRAGLPAGDPWYAPARDWAMEEGISDGTAPDRPVSRQEAVAMLHRQAGSPAAAEPPELDRDGPVSDWAREAMSWARAVGLMIHSGPPTASITRAELAELLYAYQQIVG